MLKLLLLSIVARYETVYDGCAKDLLLSSLRKLAYRGRLVVSRIQLSANKKDLVSKNA